MNLQEQTLFDQAEKTLHGKYNEKTNLLYDKKTNVNTVRSSAAYALFLLMKGGNIEKAEKIITAIINCQYTQNGFIYSGTYKRFLEEQNPPAQPTVWEDYDPNWREFIAKVFAVILKEFGNLLSDETVKGMQDSARLAVLASIERYNKKIIPMNTNIELMSIFVAEAFGRILESPEMLAYSAQVASLFLEDFKKTNTVAEFNSTTYYSVDLIALSCILKYSKTPQVLEMAQFVNQKIWESFSDFYNVSLDNPCGPYSRCYEMEMTEHSSMGDILYKCLESEDFKYLSTQNCETSSIPLVIMSGISIPENVKERFIKQCEPKLIKYQYNELCPRAEIDDRRHLCTCTAYIEDAFMMGAMSGSHNTSGQLHTGTIFWKYNNELYWIRVARRLPNRHWSEHFENIYFNGEVTKDSFYMEITSSGLQEKEIFLEFAGKEILSSSFEQGTWKLPGLTFKAEFIADDVKIRTVVDRLEMYATYNEQQNSKIIIDFKDFIRCKKH